MCLRNVFLRRFAFLKCIGFALVTLRKDVVWDLVLPKVLVPRILVVQVSQQLQVRVLRVVQCLLSSFVCLLVSLMELLFEELDCLRTVSQLLRDLDHPLPMVEFCIGDWDIVTDFVDIHFLEHVWLVLLIFPQVLHFFQVLFRGTGHNWLLYTFL